MAHIHLEDGAFTLQWVITWYVIAGLFLLLCLYWIRRKGKLDNRTIVMSAMVTAAAFAVFQVNIPIFGGVHMNLTPLIGILAGPAFGGIIVLIVNILSAAIGHGGWGLIGANVLVNMVEVLTAYLAFRWLGSLKLDIFSRAGLATLAGLAAGQLCHDRDHCDLRRTGDQPEPDGHVIRAGTAGGGQHGRRGHRVDHHRLYGRLYLPCEARYARRCCHCQKVVKKGSSYSAPPS